MTRKHNRKSCGPRKVGTGAGAVLGGVVGSVGGPLGILVGSAIGGALASSVKWCKLVEDKKCNDCGDCRS
jgi:hypothetical protein